MEGITQEDTQLRGIFWKLIPVLSFWYRHFKEALQICPSYKVLRGTLANTTDFPEKEKIRRL